MNQLVVMVELKSIKAGGVGKTKQVLAYPGAEAVILSLLEAGDVVVRVAAIPAELVLFVAGHVDVLEVPLRLLIAVPALGQPARSQHHTAHH